MSYNNDRYGKGVLNIKFKSFVFCILYLLLLSAVPGCPFRSRYSTLPDLSNCTRLEIRFLPSTLNYFFGGRDIDNLLNSAEKKYIQSIETFVMTDTRTIKNFASDISQGTFCGIDLFGGKPAYLNPVHVDCYRNERKVVSFTIYGNTIKTESNKKFEYPPGLPNLDKIEPNEIQPLRLRRDCRHNIGRLLTAGPLYRGKVSSYPEPNEWCDVILRDRGNTSYVSEERMREAFKCPCVSESKCNYAMNPNCEPNSPDDMVLLFETNDGWNQHGGPELFSFDNHDPQGGCVLLNDGTVKFIRSKEELQSLRWE